MDYDTRVHSRNQFRALVEPTIVRLGYVLSAVEMDSDRRGPIVRLFIDGPKGVGIADCASVSRALSPLLDVEDVMTGAYNLEVSSPGSDRIVENENDFARFSGIHAKVKMAPGVGRKRYSGILRGLEDGLVLLESDQKLHRIPQQDVDVVRLNPTNEEFDQLWGVITSPEGAPDDQ